MKTVTERIKGRTTNESASEKLTKNPVGIKKEYLKGLNVCRVTFTLPETAAPDAKSVYIVGDFNKWNNRANPMKRIENGDFTTMLDLETGNEYQFLYLIDESRWENDWNADKYIKSPYGDNDNSVVLTHE
ncbi:MAG: glycoside hydrolase [Candidatus Scalindua sp. AMX11]|nr:MAG: glycoside hydrolase [Candidatus Scalindua sp.]NOG83048.1 glycoside hydrolase [Planctomycetota bacterium]RZV79598.1 MAG: glycoside hydrolase [Candidatus Scalindua sp. SCAELEC01]TDE65240.1 MAG: glycoside hydrolase [Candidatus Scalindua sp. AMX11]